MTRCRCLGGGAHGPSCAALDYHDERAEERECQRIEAELRAARLETYVPAPGPAPDGGCLCHYDPAPRGDA